MWPGLSYCNICCITSLCFKGILKDVGIAKKSKLIEVQRPDLVGRYLAETGVQTKACIERAKDGVLSVDEAYRLKVDSDKDYGKEALDTLMEALLGGNPVMIFAGYPAQMEDFIKLNPGFKRRIRSIFHFQDYTCAELAEVFMLKVASRGFNIRGLEPRLRKMICSSTCLDIMRSNS